MTGESRPFAVLSDAEPVAHDLAGRYRAHLARVLASQTFANAPAQQRFLRFVVEEALAGRGESLKELVIAMSALDRGADYDPHADAAVRVVARRLRQKLHEYYESEGRDDTVRIILRAGSYRPTFEESLAATAAPSRAPDAGEPRTSPRPAAGTRGGLEAPVPRRLPVVVAIAVVVAAVGGGLWWLGATGEPRSHVVAVLPFEDATGDGGYAHVSFGVVEELITRLARTSGLRVVARTSAAQFGPRVDVREVARRLGATAVIEGSVRGDAGRLRITAQLIRAADGSHLWAQTYDRDASDLLGMQDEVARDVVAAVGAQLVGAVAAPASPRGRPAPAAVAAYWQGRYQRSLRTEEHRRRSLEYFEAAMAADPAFAPAHAAAGEVLATMAFHAEIPPAEGVARARALSRHALDLDEGVGQAHATLGWIAFFFDHDWPAAARGFRRALQLNPSDAGARQLYAQGLASQGRLEEAVTESEEAVRLDPLSYAASADLGVVLYLARRYDECLARTRQALDEHPAAVGLNGILGACAIAKGECAAGRAYVERFVERFGRVSFALARLGQADAGLGERDRARAAREEMEALASRGEAQFTHLAMLAAALGESDRALAALATAVERREADVVFLAVEPAFDPLRHDSRLAELVRRVQSPS